MQPSNDVGETSPSYDELASGSLFWTQKDPIGFNAGQSNLYAYAGDEPISQTDRTGLYLSAQCKEQIGVGCKDGCRGTCGGYLGLACYESCILLTQTIESAFPGSICNNENPTQPNSCNAESTVVFNICYETGGLLALMATALRQAKVPLDPEQKRRLIIKSISPKHRPRRPAAKAKKA